MVIFLRYYIVGIKGTGCSSLACYLKDFGHIVHGSDLKTHFFTEEKLKEKEIPIYEYNEDNIDGKDIYIIGYSTLDNIETKKIIKNDYMYYYYSDFINNLKNKNKIAISGTHGKTTTCKLLAHMLNNIKPSYIIGDGSGFGNVHSKELIFEACEYKNHFHAYYPNILIINNIELDHPDFFKSTKQIIKSFQIAASHSKYLIINGDDLNCKKIKHKNKISFGFGKDNDYVCKILKKEQNGFIISINQKIITLPFSGIHMIYNFLSCYIVIDRFYKDQFYDLNNFEYPNRRLNIKKFLNNLFVDDYAHHPTEIKALFDSVKQLYPSKRLIIIFQPHTYSRTLKLKKDFKKSLKLFDEAYIYSTFTSREKYNEKLEKKVDKIFNSFKKYNEEELIGKIKYNENNIYLFVGAGTINKYLEKLLSRKDFFR